MTKPSTRAEATFARFAPWLVFATGALVFWARAPLEQGLNPDRAYLIYMAQAVMRGEPIYQTTTFGYTPMGPLLSAAAMFLGAPFEIPSYLAPRLIALPLFALTGVLLYAVTLAITRSYVCAFWAGLINFSFHIPVAISAANLEPKLIVQVCSLAMILALQGRAWRLAGLFWGVASMSWQPALVIGLAPIALGWFSETRWSAVVRLSIGFALGIAPALLYLLLSQQLSAFMYQAIYLKALTAELVPTNTNWFQSVVLSNLPFVQQPIFLALASLGLLGYGAAYAWRREEDHTNVFASPVSGGILWLSITWVLYGYAAQLLSLELQGTPDFIVMHYLLAFWVAYGLLVSVNLARQVLGNLARRLTITVACVGIVVGLTGQGVLDRLNEASETLTAQRTLIDQTFEAERPWIAINSAFVYVLTERASPWPLLRFHALFDRYIELELPNGCDTFLADLSRGHYTDIIITIEPSMSACFARIDWYIESNPEQFAKVAVIR